MKKVKRCNPIRTVIVLLALLLTSVTASAQKTVSGLVTTTDGEPVIGATVVVKGKSGSQGAVTGIDGKFTLEGVTDGATLTVSYIGYKTQDFKAILNTLPIRVTLDEDRQSLDEVVVVGYGTQRKGLLTSAVSDIKGDEVLTTNSTNTVSRLEGKVAGLGIRQNSGEPGSNDFSINVRGYGEPIFILDGVDRISASDLNRMNPEDIESITVLKDGSAAVYGMNAGNGVVLITTKQGKMGKIQFDFGGSTSFSKPTSMPKMLNSVQYMTLRNEASYNIGGNEVYSEEEIDAYRTGQKQDTDWYGATMKGHTVNQQYNFTAQGGSGRVRFYTSLGYAREPGLLRSGAIDYEKYTFRANVTADLTNRLVAEVKFSGEYNHRHTSAQNMFNIMRGTASTLPMHTVYANDNPEYYNYTYDGQAYNPVAMADADTYGYSRSHGKGWTAHGVLTYSIPGIKGLRLKGVALYRSVNSFSETLNKAFNWYTYDEKDDTYNAILQNSPTNMTMATGETNSLNLQAHLLYDRTFAKAHHVTGTLVYEQRRYKYYNTSGRRDFSNFVLPQLNFGDTKDQLAQGSTSKTGFKSWVGKFTYDYRGRYMIEYDFRYDGSYRYSPKKRWGFFPVVSAGWRVSDEPWLKQFKPEWLTNLKLRGSYGEVGTDAGSAFQYFSGFMLNSGGYEFNDGAWVSGARAPGITNEDLTWYKSKMLDFGIDAGFFDNRLNVTFDLYRRNRHGLLATRARTITDVFGGTLPQENLNSDRTNGLEFSVRYRQRVNRDFSFNVSGNFNFARTQWRYYEHRNFSNAIDEWRNNYMNRWTDIVWMYEVIGQFQSEEEIQNSPWQDGLNGQSKKTLPGDFKYRDVDGNGIIDSNDCIPVGWNGTPKMHFGLTLGAQWRWFDFNMLWQGSAKYSVYLTHNYTTMFWNDGNFPAYFFDRWHKADYSDPNSEWIPGKWPAARTTTNNPSMMYAQSSVWRKNADYLRLKSIEVGFTLPYQWLKPLGVTRTRIYFNAYNLLTFCNSFVKPFDPEKIEGTNNAGWVYPLTKSYNIGLNIRF